MKYKLGQTLYWLDMEDGKLIVCIGHVFAFNVREELIEHYKEQLK